MRTADFIFHSSSLIPQSSLSFFFISLGSGRVRLQVSSKIIIVIYIGSLEVRPDRNAMSERSNIFRAQRLDLFIFLMLYEYTPQCFHAFIKLHSFSKSNKSKSHPLNRKGPFEYNHFVFRDLNRLPVDHRKKIIKPFNNSHTKV